MLYNLYSIYDKDAEEFGPLFNAKNDAIASRYVVQMIDGTLNVHPYGLYKMGVFDTENGICDTNVEYVSDCSDLLVPVEEDDV